MFKFLNHIDLMIDFVSNIDDPIILEFGVERGSSTRKFIDFAEKKGAKIFSVDIDDCSKVSSSKSWKFLQSDDLKVDNVIQNFEEIKKVGVDLIYIDSYHEDKHVQKLISLYFKFVKKGGAIFIDDIDSYPFRQKKNVWNSIVYDLTIDAIKEFYYNNINNCSMKIFYDKNENGLAMIHKKSDFGIEPNKIKKIWNYNLAIKVVYPYLRKIAKFLFRNEKV